MLTVNEAHDLIAGVVRPLRPVRVKFADALSLRLAEQVASDVDSPPFDKALVDGYAVSTMDQSKTLRELEMVAAGGVPKYPIAEGATIRVMTGAPVPDGADAVVAWEDCELVDEHSIRNPAAKAKPGAGILKRGSSFHRGQVLLEQGKRLGPLDIALLAEIGQVEVAAYPRPRVAVLPTGDELMDAGQPLGPGQIRNSNGPMLLAALKAADVLGVDLGIGRDDSVDLKQRIARGLQCDLLMISGGVSAGVKDLVPGVLADLGVKEQFHTLKLKPGKPLWFGVREQGDRQTLVFGLPGNPVSTLVSFRLFVLPVLSALGGLKYAPPATEPAELSKQVTHRGGRPTYFPCRRLPAKPGKSAKVELLDWKGSADLATLTRANGLAALPAGDYELAAGEVVDVLPL